MALPPICGDERAVDADKALRHQGRRTAPRQAGTKDRITHRSNKHHRLTHWQERRNAGIAKRRSGVERVLMIAKHLIGWRATLVWPATAFNSTYGQDPLRDDGRRDSERWIYEAAPQSQGNKQALSSVGTAASVAGAFIPFVRLIGPGISLVNAASGPQPDGAPASLSVDFNDDGIVRDCVYASGAIPDGLPGAASSGPVGCTRARAVP